MSNQFDDDLDDMDDTPDTEPDAQPAPRRQPTEAEIRMWRRDAKKYAETQPELTKLQRENLVLRTPGLADLTEKQTKALFATHDGEQTPEALRATAQDLGFVAAPEPEVPDADLAALNRAQQAAAGADSSAPDPLASVMSAGNEDEFWAKATSAGLVQD